MYSRTQYKQQQQQYAPSTHAADVHRLLDPSYAGTSPSSAHFHYGAQPKAYVDAAGALHDPHYREFPELPLHRDAATRARRPSVSPSRSAFDTRPSWERSRSNDDEESDDGIAWAFRRTASDLTSSSTRSRSNSDTSGNRQELYNFHHRPSFEEDVEEDIEEQELDEPSKDAMVLSKSSSSTSESIRYQMTAISLHVRLSVFRARRRWREKRQGLASG